MLYVVYVWGSSFSRLKSNKVSKCSYVELRNFCIRRSHPNTFNQTKAVETYLQLSFPASVFVWWRTKGKFIVHLSGISCQLPEFPHILLIKKSAIDMRFLKHNAILSEYINIFQKELWNNNFSTCRIISWKLTVYG